ncbi:MAG: GYD domain-containing protein [Verrucomicrobia bacterium]|nr:GYD domain-containing protein [Verrucomicrobiota bacterium]
MATYIALVSFTQQGLQNIHESPHRAAAFKSAARKAGCKVRELYWTLGEYDGVVVFDASDDQNATGLMLALSSLGNVHTKTLRAFTAAEFAAIVDQAPKL